MGEWLKDLEVARPVDVGPSESELLTMILERLEDILKVLRGQNDKEAKG